MKILTYRINDKDTTLHYSGEVCIVTMLFKRNLGTLFGILSILHLAQGNNPNITESDFIDAMLDPQVYNKVSRPFLVEMKAVHVSLDLFISSISDISVSTMDYKANFFLRQQWRDPRLSFENHSVYNYELTLNPSRLIQVWKPSTYIPNEKTNGEVHDVTVPNIMLKLNTDGTLLYSQRISTTLSCSMHLIKYPLDSQDCTIQFEIYSHEEYDVMLSWNDQKDPVQIKPNMELPEFFIHQEFKTAQCSKQNKGYHASGTFSCVEAAFKLQRRLGYYLIQIYVPSFLIVILSWVSFWIDLYAVPARISVGLLSVLTITTQASSINSNLPRVSYAKAIDIWMFTCMVFVFASLLEFSVVNVLARRQKHKAFKRHQSTIQARNASRASMFANKNSDGLKKRNNQTADDHKPTKADSGHTDAGEGAIHPDDNPHTWILSDTWEAFKFKFRRDHALRVDVMSRLMFPLSFTLFNCAYWFYYLLSPD